MNINVGKVFHTGVKSVTETSSLLQSSGSGYELRYGLELLADSGNSSSIYIGESSGIGTSGFPLSAGASLFMPIDNTELVWLTSGSGTQNLRFLGI